MAGTTTNRAYPYPASTDAPNIHTDIQSLATSIDTDLTNNFMLKSAPVFNAIVSLPAIDWGYTTTVTAAGTTTLTISSNYFQVFTGTTTQTVVMPVTSTLSTGVTYKINNNSTGNLTVNSSGGNLIITVIPNTTVTLTCIATVTTTAADWDAEFDGFHAITGSGASVLAVSPTFTGTPAAPTAAVDTNTTQIATTAYVVGQGYAKLAGPSFTGTVSMSGPLFMSGGVAYMYQPAVTSVAATATLTIAQLLTEIITYTGTAIATLTLPTGTLMDGGITGIVSNVAFEWSIVNTVAFAITMAGGTGNTYIGNTTVAANVSARFRSVRTAATTWTTYRVA